MNLIAAPLRFGLNLFLASCLLPVDFGQMVIPAAIVSLSAVLVDSGFKASLIQKSTLKNNHCSTVFFVNLGVSCILFLLFTLLALPIELFFNIENLSVLIIVTSFSLVLRSLSMVHEARMQIRGRYGLLIFIEMLSYIIGYGIAIIMAKKGYGALSIAVMSITTAIGYTGGLWMSERFLPQYDLISRRLFWMHWRMGRSLLGQGVLEVFSEKIDEILLGKFIGISKLGIYSKGREYTNTLGVIGSKFFARPWFSVMSKYSGNKIFFFERYKLAFAGLSGAGILLIAFNFYLGSTFINLVLGAQWSAMAGLFTYFVASIATYYLVVFNKYSILALGKPAINLKIELYYNFLKLSLLTMIFIFLVKNPDLIIFLILLDIGAKLIMLFFQGLSLNKFLHKQSAFIIYLCTLLLLFPFIVSLVVTSPLIFGIATLFSLVMVLVVIFTVFQKKIYLPSE